MITFPIKSIRPSAAGWDRHKTKRALSSTVWSGMACLGLGDARGGPTQSVVPSSIDKQRRLRLLKRNDQAIFSNVTVPRSLIKVFIFLFIKRKTATNPILNSKILLMVH